MRVDLGPVAIGILASILMTLCFILSKLFDIEIALLRGGP
jgi:hypothetical protein